VKITITITITTRMTKGRNITRRTMLTIKTTMTSGPTIVEQSDPQTWRGREGARAASRSVFLFAFCFQIPSVLVFI
jgi:hypothetical protein